MKEEDVIFLYLVFVIIVLLIAVIRERMETKKHLDIYNKLISLSYNIGRIESELNEHVKRMNDMRHEMNMLEEKRKKNPKNFIDYVPEKTEEKDRKL